MMEEELLMMVVLFLGGLDVILTMYNAELLQRINVWHPSYELNYLPRLLIGNVASYKKAVVYAPTQVLVLYLIILAGMYFGVVDYKMLVSALFGVLFVVNSIHYHNLRYYFLNEDNEELWDMARKKNVVAKT